MPESNATESDAREQFVELFYRDDSAIDLAEACLWISAEANPTLDVERYRARFNDLADGVRPKLSAGLDMAERVRVLADHLFATEKYCGNQGDFYDPRNSYLDCVLDRRTGIPITLSVLWIAVAQRLDIPAYGVGFPGHFLVGIQGEGPDPTPIYVDAFSGTPMTSDDCRARLREMAGDKVQFEPSMLAPTSPRQILGRVLRNLKQIHIQARDFQLAIACSDRILIVEPDQVTELRDRGLLHRALECWTSAREDLERFMVLAPGAAGESELRTVLEELKARTAQIH